MVSVLGADEAGRRLLGQERIGLGAPMAFWACCRCSSCGPERVMSAAANSICGVIGVKSSSAHGQRLFLTWRNRRHLRRALGSMRMPSVMCGRFCHYATACRFPRDSRRRTRFSASEWPEDSAAVARNEGARGVLWQRRVFSGVEGGAAQRFHADEDGRVWSENLQRVPDEVFGVVILATAEVPGCG